MIKKIIYAILLTLFFAFIGVAQDEITNKNKPPKIKVIKIKPPKTEGTKIKPPKIIVIKDPPKPPSVILPVVIKPIPLPAQILWTDDCDPRTDSLRCSISTREAVTAGFYDVVKSVNAKITYKIPDSIEELKSYKVVIVYLCSDEINENSINLIKEYLQGGGSAFILGGNTCQPGGHPTSWWASQITKDFGVTFGTKDDSNPAWTDDAVGTHPITLKLKKIYFSQHADLNVSDPSEPILSVSGKPIAAVYSGIGAFVALSDDAEFGWQPNRWENLGPTDNFTFWRNSLRWLINQSKIKKSKNAAADTSAGLIVSVNQKDVKIFIDELEYDVRSLKSPFKYDSLSPGTYTIRVEKAGYKTETRTVILTPKQKLSVKFVLTPITIR
jgi:PEGA domain